MPKHLNWLLPIAVGCLLAGSAAAEDTEAVPAQPETMPTELEEVIVTATKHSENVREIPASIATVSGEELEQRGAQDTADIVKLVPGVNVTASGDSPQRVTIRGISSDINTSSTTGILFGNVSFSEAYVPVVALDPNPFDMGSVEVLKGPQGTLYGASALNGAVRYVPMMPKFGVYEAKYFAQYTWVHDGASAPTFGAAVNAPIGDDLALRVMAFDRTSPGYIDNEQLHEKDVNRITQQGARALLDWRPAESWDALLTTTWQSTYLHDVGVADSDDGDLETDNRPRKSPNKTRYAMVDLSLKYSADWAQLVSDTSYIDKHGHNFFDATSRYIPNSSVPILSQYYTGVSDTLGEEVRLGSIDDPANRWKWTTGLFAWQQHLTNAIQVPLAVDVSSLSTIVGLLQTAEPALGSLLSTTGSPLVYGSAANVRVRELAAFGDLTRKFSNDVEVSLGGRLYHTSSGGQNIETGASPEAEHGSSPYVLSGGVKASGFNPKASVLWHITDDVLTYALISKGFRVGGLQFGVTTPVSEKQAPTTFKSDTLWNYETGVRTQWFDNKLRADLTAFYVDWKDPQTLQPDASGLSNYIDNVGGVSSVGADFSMQYLLPLPGVMFTTSAAYADTKSTKDFVLANGTTIPKGVAWSLAPKWQTASNLSFLRPLGDWTLGGFATYTFLGPTVPYITGRRIFDYHQVDLQLSVSNEHIKWLPEMAVVCNNLTDERGLTFTFSSNLPTAETAAHEYYYITPRAISLRFSGHFGG